MHCLCIHDLVVHEIVYAKQKFEAQIIRHHDKFLSIHRQKNIRKIPSICCHSQYSVVLSCTLVSQFHFGRCVLSIVNSILKLACEHSFSNVHISTVIHKILWYCTSMSFSLSTCANAYGVHVVCTIFSTHPNGIFFGKSVCNLAFRCHCKYKTRCSECVQDLCHICFVHLPSQFASHGSCSRFSHCTLTNDNKIPL